MSQVQGPGFADLEKELVCSVCTCQILIPYIPLIANRTDLYRASLPTPHPPRLPPHLLRILRERVVLRTGITSN
jgi:hypothetical protein